MISKYGVRAIVSSDWHLDAVTAGEERFADVTRAADQVANYAIESDRGDSRSLFVFAGDLTNPDPPRCWRAVEYAAQLSRRLEYHGIPSIWIAGNHDVLEDGYGSHSLMPIDTRLPQDAGAHGVVVAMPKLVFPFSYSTSRTRGPGILCFPYVPRSHAYVPTDVIARYVDEEPTLIVGHLMLEGISVGSETNDFARGRDLFLPIEGLRKTWPDVPIVNGHYHEGQLYKSIHIPGSIARLTLGEANNSPRFLEIAL
jgi:DNA repair exonuclease SbcCD nuclease subunit